jgi:serine protease inhibitor
MKEEEADPSSMRTCNLWAKEAGKISIPKLLSKHSVAWDKMQNISQHLSLTGELWEERDAPQRAKLLSLNTCYLNHPKGLWS